MINVESIADVLGGRETLKRDIHSLGELSAAVQRGLPKKTLRSVVLHVTRDRKAVAELMYRVVPQPSYKRRTTALSPAESERTERLARVIATALYVWDDEEQARHFLTRPHPALADRTPIEAALSELGARQVEELLWSLFYGLPA